MNSNLAGHTRVILKCYKDDVIEAIKCLMTLKISSGIPTVNESLKINN